MCYHPKQTTTVISSEGVSRSREISSTLTVIMNYEL